MHPSGTRQSNGNRGGGGTAKEEEGRGGWRETDSGDQQLPVNRKKKNCRKRACCLVGTWAPSNRNRVCDSGGNPILNKRELTPSLYSCRYKLELMLNYTGVKKDFSLSLLDYLFSFFFTTLHSWPPLLTLAILSLQSISAVKVTTHTLHTYNSCFDFTQIWL